MNKNKGVRLLLLLFALCLGGVRAVGAADYTELNLAVTNFFKAMDVIAKELPAVNSATGTVHVIDIWSEANTKFAASANGFLTNNPGIKFGQDPPPEFAEAFGKLSRLKTDYAAVTQGLGPLMDKYGTDPEVQKAIVRFRKSITEIENVKKNRKR